MLFEKSRQIAALLKKKEPEKSAELSARQKKMYLDSPGRSLKLGRLVSTGPKSK